MSIETQPDQTLVQSPEYEELYTAMLPHLSRVAVMHPAEVQYDFDTSTIKYATINTSGSAAGRPYTIERASTLGAPEQALPSYDSIEKSTTLHMVRSALVLAAASSTRQPQPGQIDTPDWRKSSSILMDLASNAEDKHAQDTFLVAAVVASQLDHDADTRINFVKTVYQNGLQNQLSDACEHSHIVIVHADPELTETSGGYKYHDAGKVSSVKHMAAAFQADSATALDYLGRIRPADPDTGLPSAKSVKRTIMESLPQGDIAEGLRQTAKDVSTNHEKVTDIVLDPYKVERFALE